jgi:hypothetical protein
MMNNSPPPKKKNTIYEITWKNIVVGQVTGDNMVHAHCILDTQGHNHNLRILIVTAFTLWHWLHERSSVLCFMYMACLF